MARDATGQIIERRGRQGIAYAARVRANGQRHYLTLGHSRDGCTRRQAESELQNIVADIRRGIWQPPQLVVPVTPKDPSFHEFASEWLAAHRHELAASSTEVYEWTLTHHLLPHFKDHRLTQITIAEVDRYKTSKTASRKPDGSRALSNSSVNKTLSILAQVLESAVEYGLIEHNPARGRRRRLKSASPRRSWLEPEQVKPLIEATVRELRGGGTLADERMRALFATGICTGLRVGELLALRWAQVDLAGDRLTVLEAKTDAGAGREIDLWPELRDALAGYRALATHTRSEDHVFATRNGRTDTRWNIAKRLKRAATRANAALADAGLPQIDSQLTPHSLRRTFASLLYLRGESPVYVMHQMGHTDPKLALRIYTKMMGVQRRHPGTRLIGVLDGVRWSEPDARGSAERAIAPLGETAEAGG